MGSYEVVIASIRSAVEDAVAAAVVRVFGGALTEAELAYCLYWAVTYEMHEAAKALLDAGARMLECEIKYLLGSSPDVVDVVLRHPGIPGQLRAVVVDGILASGDPTLIGVLTAWQAPDVPGMDTP